MTALAFLCLTRDAGSASRDLCGDVAAFARPGDLVVIVDDGGDADNAGWTGRFVVGRGFGRGVTLRRIVTGTRGAGDLGIAVDLALAEAAADPEIRHAAILPGRVRLDPEGFRAVRARLDGDDPTLVLDAGRMAEAGLWPMILSRRLFAGPDALRADEGRAGGGLLALSWRARARAAHRADPGGMVEADTAFVRQRNPGGFDPDTPGPDWFRAASALVRAKAGDPALAPWLWAGLERAFRCALPGAALALVAPLERLARRCPPPLPASVAGRAAGGPPPRAGDRLGPALRAEDPAAALRALATSSSAPLSPGLTERAALRVACLGRHAHRMPLAYPVLAPEWEGRIALSDPATADLILFAHPQDPGTLTAAVAGTLPGRTLALLSEEPFWDSLFSPDPLATAVTLPVAHLGPVRLHQINHHTSPIFAFDRLPYQPLTEPRFAAAYARLFARNAALVPADWQAAFAGRPLQAAFMAERRPEPFHDLALPRGDVVGLCAWRTRLAEGYATGQVARFGASWQGGPTRFDLTDWHADKLVQLDKQARLISAVENTHQPAYLSEKLFDAFACGGRPVYLASPGHRAHDLGLPAAAWINLWSLTSAEAPAVLDAAPWDAAFLDAYARAQVRLAALWTDADLIAAERARTGRAVIAELARLADLGPA